jgi:hypothetical protein
MRFHLVSHHEQLCRWKLALVQQVLETLMWLG